MRQSDHQERQHSSSMPISLKSDPNLLALSSKGSKTGQILKLQSQISKLKQIVSLQGQLRRNKEQFQKLSGEIFNLESQVKTKRKQALRERIADIEKRKSSRQTHNKESNHILSRIKLENRNRRQRMESLVNAYKQEYQKMYNNQIDRRKKQMRLDIDSIKHHESQYMKNVRRRQSYRVKTENNDREGESKPIQNYQKSFIEMELYRKNQHNSKNKIKKETQSQAKLIQIAEQFKNTIDKGRKAQQFKQKQRNHTSVQQFKSPQPKFRKMKLDTNLSGNIDDFKNKQLTKIAHSPDGSAKQKIVRLKNIAQGYMVRYDNGQDELLDKICKANLLRADLLLNDS